MITASNDTESTLDAIAEMVMLPLRGIGYFFRWPYALTWVRRNAEHHWYKLSIRGQVLFFLLCVAGMLAQVAFATTLFIGWLASFHELYTATWVAAAVFVVLTVVRFIVWARIYSREEFT